MMFDAFRVVTPPAYVKDPERWRKIVPLRLRCGHWWVAAMMLKTMGWALAIGTVIVAGIAAGRPGFIHAASAWDESTVRSWSTVVAVMSGLSGLIPWQKTGLAFERANEVLSDGLALYDADPRYTVEDVVRIASEARKEIRPIEEKASRSNPPGFVPSTDSTGHKDV